MAIGYFIRFIYSVECHDILLAAKGPCVQTYLHIRSHVYVSESVCTAAVVIVVGSTYLISLSFREGLFLLFVLFKFIVLSFSIF